MKRQPLISLSLLALAHLLSAAGIATTGPASDEIVQLPAFVVGDKAINPIQWLYAEVPGIEILSCLPPADTARIVNALREQSRLLAWELPPELRSLPGRPAQLVLDDRPLASLRLPLNRSALRRTAAGDRRTVVGMVLPHWDFTSSYINDSRGGASIFSAGQAVLAKFSATQIGAASVGLLNQTPAPPWLMQFWGSVSLDRYARGDSVTFTTMGQSTADKSSADKKLPLPGLALVFGNPPGRAAETKPTTATADEAGQWFIRWALYADEGAHRAAFWNFVKANTLQPEVDDALVRQHFSVSLAELDRLVGKFRQEIQATRDLRIQIPLGPVPPALAVRVANEGEIARILGQWAFLALRNNPGLAVPLSAAARRVLDRGRQLRSDDAQLTALLGLVELESGNIGEARALLESVADSPGIALRSRFELARLRHGDALANPATAGGKFDPTQVAAILAPLAPFRLKPPGNAEPLALVAQTWVRSAEKPTREELKAFAGLARQFPRSVEILLPTAQLCFEQSLDHEARELVAIGLLTTNPEPAVHAALLALREELDARAAAKK